MADPVNPLSRSDVAAADAEILRQRLQAVRQPFARVFPATDQFILGGGPVGRRLERAGANPVPEVVEYAGFKGLVPGGVKRGVAKYVAGVLEGVETEQATGGETAVAILEALTDLPDPAQYGIARNAYLPAGITHVIPGSDRLRIIGFAEQAADDREAARQRIEGIVQRASTQDLADLLFRSRGVLVSQRAEARLRPDATVTQFDAAVRQELTRRIGLGTASIDAPGGGAAGTPAGLVPAGAPAGLVLIGAPIAMGSILPQRIRPIRNLAIASGEAAEGVRQDIASERADP